MRFSSFSTVSYSLSSSASRGSGSSARAGVPLETRQRRRARRARACSSRCSFGRRRRRRPSRGRHACSGRRPRRPSVRPAGVAGCQACSATTPGRRSRSSKWPGSGSAPRTGRGPRRRRPRPAGDRAGRAAGRPSIVAAQLDRVARSELSRPGRARDTKRCGPRRVVLRTLTIPPTATASQRGSRRVSNSFARIASSRRSPRARRALEPHDREAGPRVVDELARRACARSP